MSDREAFEKWAKEEAKKTSQGFNELTLERDYSSPDYYAKLWVNAAWRGWQASRQALSSCSENPNSSDPVAYDMGDEIYGENSGDMNDYIRQNGRPLVYSDTHPASADAAEVWEKAMMAAIGEDGPRSVADAISRLQVRVAELYSALDNVNERLADGCQLSGDEIDDVDAALLNTGCEAFILRKQADAVEAFVDWVKPHWPTSIAIQIADDGRNYVFDLRNEVRAQEQDDD